MPKLTLEEFIERARLKHGDKYDYSKVDYKTCDTNVIIICPIHGDFKQTPYKHTNMGRGCQICSRIKSDISRRSNTKEFIKRAKLKHGNKYNYSKVDYKTSSKKVIIICPIHGEFLQTPS